MTIRGELYASFLHAFPLLPYLLTERVLPDV